VRVLITGGAGFIGSRLAANLEGSGHEVTVLDSLLPQIHGSVPEDSELLDLARRHSRVVIGDVTDRIALTDALAGQDAVVHLAAETGTGQSMYEIERYNYVNVGGTALLLDILANDEARTVNKVVVASSRSIYGEGRYVSKELGDVYPGTRRDADLAAGRFEPSIDGDVSGLTLTTTHEESKIHPSSVYGITKHTQEALVMTVCPTLDVAGVSLRYQNVYGPGQSLTNPYTGILSIFSTLIRQGKGINIFEDGEESRDFVYIDDIVEATARAVTDVRANNQIFNVGSGERTTVRTVAEELMRAYGIEVPMTVTGNYRLGDIRHNVADISRIKQVLDFEPTVSFPEGVSRFAAWVTKHEVSDAGYERSLQEMREKKLLK
jgi:dTDP-L-rhamnose 4-epimerase